MLIQTEWVFFLGGGGGDIRCLTNDLSYMNQKWVETFRTNKKGTNPKNKVLTVIPLNQVEYHLVETA